MRWLPTIVCGTVLSLAPILLWRPALSSYYLKLDDFVYLSRGRVAANLARNLLTPHNGHLTPLFLIQTHVCARLAGTIEALPTVLGWTAFACLAATSAGAGSVVARRTGRVEWGLAAMAGFGFSSVVGPALLWYSASQALLTTAVATAMLAALEAWCATGRLVPLVLGFFLAAAAPFCWSAGYTAGLVGAAYLSAESRPGARAGAIGLGLASGLAAAFAWFTAGDAILESTRPARSSLLELVIPIRVLDHTNQAAWEKLVFNNLGLDAPTTAGQARVLSLLVLAAWFHLRSRTKTRAKALDHPVPSVWNPLTAAGAAIVAANYALVFATRGRTLGYEHLRHLGWYDAVPQLGAVLFAAGVWAGPRACDGRRRVEPPALKSLAGVIAFAALFFLMQRPRAERILREYDGMAARVVRLGDETPPPRVSWAPRALDQRKALAGLDRIEQDQRPRAGAPAERSGHAPPLTVPGAPSDLPGYRLTDLIDAARDPEKRP